MHDIYVSEEIIFGIENHEHYDPCLNGYDYAKFKDVSSKIRQIRDFYKDFVEKERSSATL